MRSQKGHRIWRPEAPWPPGVTDFHIKWEQTTNPIHLLDFGEDEMKGILKVL